MRKASEYRQHAKECRALSNQAVSDEHRKQLTAMAETWETLALEREKITPRNDEYIAGRGSEPLAEDQRRKAH